MAQKSYNNPINTDQLNVSLAIEQILLAPYPGTWNNTRITLDNSAIPSGFRHLGAIVEDSVQIRLTKTNFQLRTGIPASLQYQANTDLAGQLQFALHTYNPWKVQYALGNTAPIVTVDNSPALISTSIMPTYTSVTLSNSTPINVGDLVVAMSSIGSLAVSDNGAQVTSIAAGVIYVSSPGFPTLPQTGWFLSKVYALHQPYGTALIRDFTVLGVADFIDGTQVVHHFPRAQSAGEYTESLKPSENPRPPFALDIFGALSSETWEGNSELILGTRWVFPKAT